LSFTAQLGSAKIALALLLRVIFFQKSLAQGLTIHQNNFHPGPGDNWRGKPQKKREFWCSHPPTTPLYVVKVFLSPRRLKQILPLIRARVRPAKRCRMVTLKVNISPPNFRQCYSSLASGRCVLLWATVKQSASANLETLRAKCYSK
jgi:hypothetical protein